MATKLKRYNPVLKTAAFVLLVAVSAVVALRIVIMADDAHFWKWHTDDIGKTEFSETRVYESNIMGIYETVQIFIKAAAGELNPNTNIEQEKQNLFNQVQEELRQYMLNRYVEEELTENELRKEFENNYKYAVDDRIQHMFRTYREDILRDIQDEAMQRNDDIAPDAYEVSEDRIYEVFERDYAELIEEEKEILFNNYREEITNNLKWKWAERNLTHERIWKEFEEQYAIEIEDLSQWNNKTPEFWLNALNDSPGVIFRIEVDGTVYTNTELSVEEIKADYDYFDSDNSPYNSERTSEHPFIFAFTDDYISEKNAELAAANNEIWELMIFLGICAAVYLLCVIYLIYAAGRRTTDGSVKMFTADKLFTEITLGLVAFGIFCLLLWLIDYYTLYNNHLFKYIYIGVTVFIFAAVYTLISSVIRNMKNRSFIKNSLIYKIIIFAVNAFKKGAERVAQVYGKSNSNRKIYVLIGILGLLTMIPFFGIITVPFSIFLAYKQISSFEEIIAKEAERRSKSERLKTELIVNVSHDIRTPLTSLITYADLLKNEETDNENIIKYVEVISQKSDRLRVLTDDLFEAAKAASGNVTVNIDKVEINSLFKQALAEFDDKIKQSNLTFKVNIPEEKVSVSADGQLLWRVIENLMSNALKYSLEHSRVYIDVTQKGGDVIIEMKNISATELNIPEDEITERFKRGDLARNSEGSGLGLDIASSLMRCQNGKLTVKIDGDLFKVSLRLPRVD